MRRRKANKILMAIVLILLCLVLMTTSVVSGIFAKYTVSKQILMMFAFESFGVKIDVFIDESIKEKTGVTINGDGTAQIEISNLLMHPGDIFDKALTFKISGNPTADAELKVKVTVNNENDAFTNAFTVKKDAFPDHLDKDTVYVPMGFYVNESYAVNPYSNSTAESIGTSITNAVPAKTFTKGVEINTEDISFGFDWQKEYKSVELSDEIGTWISNQTPSFTITYEISVEQITGSIN